MKISDIAKITTGSHINKELFNNNGNILYLSAKNIGEDNDLILKSNKFIMGSQDLNNRHIIEKNDILMVNTGDKKNIGKYYIYDLPIKAIAGNTLYIIKADDINNFKEILDEKYYNIKLLIKGEAISRIFAKDFNEMEI